MTVPVHDLDGTTAGEVDLPDAFDAGHRPDLVKRAVLAAQANRKQDYGSDDYAGMRTPAESFGSGGGMANVPREGGQARRVPQAVGGRRAHPPKEEKDRSLDLNDKERKAAIRAAIAATADADVVRERGHAFDDDVDLRSDFDLSAIRIGDEDEPNYRGDINGGGPELYLEADDGDVALRTR